MTGENWTLTRRAALAGLGGLILAEPTGLLSGIAQEKKPFSLHEADKIPVTGKAGPGLEPFDKAMLQIMDRHGVPGAALAIAKDGKLVLAKGYGWADITTGEAVQPDTLFGLASVSKPLTAVAVLQLVEQGKLGLDDPVFNYLKHIGPPRGGRDNPALTAVTVRQCLNHSGGWDRAVNGDPVNWEPQICRAFRVRPPLSANLFVSFVRTLPLDFKPGTDAKYSNIGYILLGEVIGKLSGQSYETYVAENVLKPMGITSAALHRADGKYLRHASRRHLAGTAITLPAMRLPMVDATGGWCGSVVDLARFLSNLDGSRGKPVLTAKTRELMRALPPKPLMPRDNGTWFGLGWDSVIVKDKTFGYFKDGSYQGMRTFIKRLPTGVNWALLYNASMEFDPHDVEIATSTVKEVRQLVERFEKYPDIDLFKEFGS